MSGSTTGRAVTARRVMPAVLISLMGGLGLLVPAPQAALAASQGASSISAGGVDTCSLESGKAYCWGWNNDGELGDGNTADSSVPVAVDTSGLLAGKALTQIAARGGHTCVLDSAGAAYCWGDNSYGGPLGDGSTANSSVPVAVDAGGALARKTLTQITGGYSHTCALDSAGAAYCWGDNSDGQLGDGSTANSSVPVAVDVSGALAGKTLIQITAGGFHTCALDSAGAAYCWGDNSDGQLGDGSTANSSVPLAMDPSGVLAGQTITHITAGDFHTCALDSASVVYCWGGNYDGQLGDGSTTQSSDPVAVDTSGALAGKTITQISAGSGGDHTCALAASGAAYCWGLNVNGELGDRSTAESTVPVAVDTSGALAGKTLAQITAGGDHTCAVDANGAAYCWGGDTGGDLGNDNVHARSDVPVLAGPGAPASVTATPGNTTATVSWAAPAWLDSGSLTGYTATASSGNSACTTTGATTCTITGLTNGTTYSITVVTHTTVGDSGASASATVIPEPTGAPAGPIVSGYHKSKCVDDNNDSAANDAKIVTWDCNGTPEQNWVIETDGTIQINGKCMDIYRDGKTNKAPVELWTCTGGANQQWQPRNGTLVNPVSGKCLDDPRFNTTDGIQLEIYTCNGGSNQQWKLP